MANPSDKEIKIGIVTTADTSGIEKVIDAEDKLAEATKEAEAGGTRGFGGMLDVKKVDESAVATKKLSDGVETLSNKSKSLKVETDKLEEAQEASNSTMRLGGAAMTGVAAGGAIVAKIFGQIGEAIRSIDVENLKQLNAEMAAQVEQAQTWAEVLTDPVNGIQRLLSGTSIGEAFGDLNKSLEDSANYAETLNKNKVAASLKQRGEIKKIYDEETTALIRQKTEIERILELRAKMAQLTSEGFNQEVEATKIRGGDVAAAEANALATKLQQGLQELSGKLQIAQQDRAVAQQQFDSTVAQYKKGVEDGLAKLDPAQLTKLAESVDAAQTQLQNADQVVTDQKQVFEASRLNFLRGTEIELNKLETEYGGQVSAAAKRGFDGIYQKLQDEVAAGPVQAVTNIQAATAQITEAANQKGVEIGNDIATAANTVSQSGQAIQSAFQTYGEKAGERDAKILSAVNGLTSLVEASLQTISQLQGRIAQMGGQ